MATKSITFAYTGANIGLAGTGYWSLNGENNSSAEGRVQRLWLEAGTLRNWRVKLSAVVPASTSLVITIRLNEADSATTLTFNAGDQEKEFTSDLSVSASDRISVKTVVTGPGSIGSASWSLEFEPSSGNKSCYGHNTTDGTAGTPLYFGALCGNNGGALSLNSLIGVIPCAGTITALGALLESAPGGSHVYSIWLSTNNGSSFTQQNGAGGSVDTRVTLSGSRTGSSAFSLSVSAGDLVYITYERISGGAINVYGGVSIAFDPTTAGQFIIPGLSRTNLTNSATVYAGAVGAVSSFSSSVVEIVTPISAISIGNFRIYLETAPGSSKSYQFDFTEDGSTSPVSGSPTITMSGTNQTGVDSSNAINLTDGHTFTIREVPNSTPAVGKMTWGLVGSYGASATATAFARGDLMFFG